MYTCSTRTHLPTICGHHDQGITYGVFRGVSIPPFALAMATALTAGGGGEDFYFKFIWYSFTFAGYGDIHAVNLREMIFIMIYVSFGMVLGAYLIGNMTAIVVKG